MFLFPKRIPIPEIFHSADTRAPLDRCLVCERPLLDTEEEYLIEKAMRQYPEYELTEVIIEYALCLDCHADMQNSISDASKHALETYFLENADLHERIVSLMADDSPRNIGPSGDAEADELDADHHTDSDERAPDVEKWLERCIIHGTPMDELKEFQLVGHCVGREMLMTHMPLVIGGPAMDEIIQQLSNETLDELGGFRDEYFGLPPEFSRDVPGPVLA
jgi:uncharacterized protein with PIN domain